MGLFTKIARKKDEEIIGYPGYFMHSKLFANEPDDNAYAFEVPKEDGSQWGPMKDLVYVTHNSQATFINAGVIDTRSGGVVSSEVYNTNTNTYPRTHAYTRTPTGGG